MKPHSELLTYKCCRLLLILVRPIAELSLQPLDQNMRCFVQAEETLEEKNEQKEKIKQTKILHWFSGRYEIVAQMRI